MTLKHEGYCFTNYADTTPHVAANNAVEEVVENLTNITQKLFTWFASNLMKANPGKWDLLLSTQEEADIQIANATIESSMSQKLLGVVIDDQLKFELHIGNICQNVNRNLNALARLTNGTKYSRVDQDQVKADPESLLNTRDEFVSKCRHMNKFTLRFFKKK